MEILINSECVRYLYENLEDESLIISEPFKSLMAQAKVVGISDAKLFELGYNTQDIENLLSLGAYKLLEVK